MASKNINNGKSTPSKSTNGTQNSSDNFQNLNLNTNGATMEAATNNVPATQPQQSNNGIVKEGTAASIQLSVSHETTQRNPNFFPLNWSMGTPRNLGNNVGVIENRHGARATEEPASNIDMSNLELHIMAYQHSHMEDIGSAQNAPSAAESRNQLFFGFPRQQQEDAHQNDKPSTMPFRSSQKLALPSPFPPFSREDTPRPTDMMQIEKNEDEVGEMHFDDVEVIDTSHIDADELHDIQHQITGLTLSRREPPAAVAIPNIPEYGNGQNVGQVENDNNALTDEMREYIRQFVTNLLERREQHRQLPAIRETATIHASEGLQIRSNDQHYARMKNARPYLCSYKYPSGESCDATYNSHHSLRMHARRHTEEHPFVCGHNYSSTTRCCASFKTANHLNQHMRSHVVEHPFKCEKCSAAFTSYCNLQRHEMVHEDDKPRRCKYCGKKFGNAVDRHVHEGLCPYRQRYEDDDHDAATGGAAGGLRRQSVF